MDITEFQKLVLEKASVTRGYGGHAAASCRRHLERAWKLQEDMPEVSIFLAITAEEEAASAIFNALTKRRYDCSQKLSRWNHKYKAGVYPFLQLVRMVLIPPGQHLDINLGFNTRSAKDNSEILELSISFLLGGEQIKLMLKPPLGFISRGQDDFQRDYTQEIRSIASEQGIDSVYKHIQARANVRNQMLYASDSGIPSIKFADKKLRQYTDAAVLNLIIYLLIEPHPKQGFAQEALYSYLKILDRIESRKT